MSKLVSMLPVFLLNATAVLPAVAAESADSWGRIYNDKVLNWDIDDSSGTNRSSLVVSLGKLGLQGKGVSLSAWYDIPETSDGYTVMKLTAVGDKLEPCSVVMTTNALCVIRGRDRCVFRTERRFGGCAIARSGFAAFFCITFDRKVVRLYKDGCLVTEFREDAECPDESLGLEDCLEWLSGLDKIGMFTNETIGCVEFPDNSSKASLGEVRVYNKVLDESEVRRLYCEVAEQISFIWRCIYRCKNNKNGSVKPGYREHPWGDVMIIESK